jgi:hypothetical protein
MGQTLCTFCGSIMGLSHATPASSDTHALRFFLCDTCGASELRVDHTGEGSAGSGSAGATGTRG